MEIWVHGQVAFSLKFGELLELLGSGRGKHRGNKGNSWPLIMLVSLPPSLYSFGEVGMSSFTGLGMVRPGNHVFVIKEESGWSGWCRKNQIFFFFFSCFWLCRVFIALCGLSPVAVSGDYSLSWRMGSSFQGFPHCGAQALGEWGSVVVAHGP